MLNKKTSWLLYIGIFLITVLIYTVILIVDKAYPFGERSFLTYDAYVQYKNMFHMFFDWISSDNKGIFLWNSGLGIDAYHNMIYYCLSPFNVIVLLLGEKQLELSMILLIIIKSSCVSVSALYFFRNTNKRNSNCEYSKALTGLIEFACSLAYGLSGYVLAYGHNIMWLDGMILLPVIAIAIERFSSNLNYKMYIICLSLAFVVNFYYSLYICLFAVIYFLLENRNSIKAFVKKGLLFVGISILAVMIAGVIIIPAVFVIMNSASSVNSINMEGLNMWGVIGEYIASFYPLNEITCTSLFCNNSFCGSVVIFLMALFFVSNICTKKTKIKYGIAVAFLILGLNYLPVNYVLHGFALTHGLGNRFAFVLTFLLVIMAYMVIMNISNIKMSHTIMGIIVTVLIFVISIVDNRDMSVPWAYIIFMFIIFFAAILLILWKRNSIQLKSLMYILMYIWMIEIIVNAIYTMPEKTNDISMEESIKLNEWENIYEELNTASGERKTALVGENYTPYSETSWYSSMVNGNIIHAFSSMGLGHFDNVEYVYNGTTPLTALMYNVRYVLTDELGTLGGYHLISENDSYNLYEADALAGMGFVLNDDIVSWNGMKNVFENQNDFIKKGCGINEDAFVEVNMNNMETTYFNMEKLKSETGYCLYKTNSVFSPIIKYEFDADRDMDLYMYSMDTRDQYVVAYIDDKCTVSSGYYLTEFISHIGCVKTGQHVKILVYGAVSSKFGQVGEKRIKMYSLNNKLFEDIKTKLIDETMEFVEYKGNMFTGRIVSENGGILYLAFPYNDGFTVRIDGELTDKLRLGNGFMGINITAGEHEITIEYHTPGRIIGLCVSIIGLVILFIIMIITKKKISFR